VTDNVGVDNATLASYTVSSDEAASGQLQRVKLAYSADGVDTHVTADAQGLKVQGQVSLANSVVNVSQAGSYSVTQGTSPGLPIGGRLCRRYSPPSQAGSYAVTPTGT
jgi:hypothetical protein